MKYLKEYIVNIDREKTRDIEVLGSEREAMRKKIDDQVRRMGPEASGCTLPYDPFRPQ